MSEGRPGSGESDDPRVGPYTLLQIIGRGATGTVYRARADVTGQIVALKMLHGGAGADTVERFTREIAVAQQLVHRHVVSVIDAGLEDGLPYLVMELLRGQSLRDLVREHTDGVGIDRAVDLVAQLCMGLHHAHEHGLVHRDVKPANVFVTKESVVKVLDFGVAKLTDTTVTADGALVGTLTYMAPEQLRARGEVDGRADIFSAGVLLYELLTGRRPFQSDSPQAILGRILNDSPPPLPPALGVSPELQAILFRALEKDADRRFPTAQEFGHALWAAQFDARARAQVIGGLPLREPAGPPGPEFDATLKTAPPIEPAPELVITDPARPQRWKWGVAAVLALALGAAVTVIVRTQAGAPPAPPTVTPAPPAPVPVPTVGDVRIESTPPGAEVSRNGTTAGVTPLTVALNVDERLQLTLPGFEPASVAVDAGTLAAGRIDVALQPLAAVRLRASGPYPFEIVAGGETISRSATSHDVSVPVGQAVILRSRDLLLNQPVTIDAAAGGTQTVQVPAPGRLSIRTLPGPDEQCRVLIDQRDFSNPPLSNIPVAAGSHQIVLQCPGGSTKRERLRVASGESVAHTVR